MTNSAVKYFILLRTNDDIIKYNYETIMNNKNKYLYLSLINQVYMYLIYVDSVRNLYKLCVNSIYHTQLFMFVLTITISINVF